MKRCTKCGVEKPTSAFYVQAGRRPRKNGGPSGFDSRCKQCHCDTVKANKAKRILSDPTVVLRLNAETRARNQRLRDAVFAAYGGYRCVCCGENEPKFLSIDHVDNDGADWRRQTFGSRFATGRQTYQWLRRHNYPDGFQVLCMNCNFGKRMNGGTCPHQARRNDYPVMGVEASASKRTASVSVH